MAWHSPLTGEIVGAAPLPFSGLEARYVASVRAGSRSLVEQQATMSEVRPALRNYRLLHFATHGVLNERAPLSSAILLANGEALTPADFLGIGLSADLVVLSGCRTGLGDVTPGDEIVGLTRTLLGSGTRAAVVSLWPVRDAATSYLMRQFYEHLVHAGPADALKRAQTFVRDLTLEQQQDERQKLIESQQLRDVTRDLGPSHSVAKDVDYSHPYFWAPFIFVGAQ